MLALIFSDQYQIFPFRARRTSNCAARFRTMHRSTGVAPELSNSPVEKLAELIRASLIHAEILQ